MDDSFNSITLDKSTQFHYIEIWEPKWSTRRVLINPHKVGEHNKIVFTGNPKTGTNTMGSDPYYLSGKTIKKYGKVSNGTMKLYAVPLDELKKLEINERDWRLA